MLFVEVTGKLKDPPLQIAGICVKLGLVSPLTVTVVVWEQALLFV